MTDKSAFLIRRDLFKKMQFHLVNDDPSYERLKFLMDSTL